MHNSWQSLEISILPHRTMQQRICDICINIHISKYSLCGFLQGRFTLAQLSLLVMSSVVLPRKNRQPNTTLEPTLIMRYSLLEHPRVTMPSIWRGWYVLQSYSAGGEESLATLAGADGE